MDRSCFGGPPVSVSVQLSVEPEVLVSDEILTCGTVSKGARTCAINKIKRAKTGVKQLILFMAVHTNRFFASLQRDVSLRDKE